MQVLRLENAFDHHTNTALLSNLLLTGCFCFLSCHHVSGCSIQKHQLVAMKLAAVKLIFSLLPRIRFGLHSLQKQRRVCSCRGARRSVPFITSISTTLSSNLTCRELFKLHTAESHNKISGSACHCKFELVWKDQIIWARFHTDVWFSYCSSHNATLH